MGTITVLGISPGTRYMGVALLRDGELYSWKVRSYKGICTPEKLDNSLLFIEQLIISHVVKSIACKMPHPGRTSDRVKNVINQIQDIADEYEIECSIYSIEDLRRLFKMKFANKYILAEHVVNRFPQLTELLVRERKNKHRYHICTFEAIAAGLKCHQDYYS